MTRSWYQEAILGRATIKAWCENALSDTVVTYRIETLGKAFGLHPDFVRRYIAGESCMGHGLRDWILNWCEDNPDISPNNPTDDTHWIADIKFNDG